MINYELFDKCCKEVFSNNHFKCGIGSIGEKTLHAVLKNYYSPNKSNQEIKVGKFVADIVDENQIIEIQTRSFSNMKKKLDFFLMDTNVLIIYPAFSIKWVQWLNPTTGELSKKHKSPKKDALYDIFWELAHIKPYLNNPKLRLQIVVMEVIEIRLLDGWSADKKRGSTRYNVIPLGLLDEIVINEKDDYTKFIPRGLDENFIRKDFEKLAGLSKKRAGTVINVLVHVGVIGKTDKRGKYIIVKYSCYDLK